MMMLYVAFGGAIGAVSRWWLSNQMTAWMGQGFPWGTFTVNILGSFLLGALAEMLARSWDLSPEVQTMIRVGFLGAFTTFSTFSLDAYSLIFVQKQALLGAAYVLGSVVLGLGALMAGMALVKALMP